MATYRYHFYDQRTGARTDILPMENVTFSAELRGVGSLTGDIPLFADELHADRVMAATIPHRTKVFVERDNALVWGGRVVPPRGYDSMNGRVTINAEETLGVFETRFLPTMTFNDVDQLDIARVLIDVLQVEDGGDMGLALGGGLSGIDRDRTYSAADRTTGLTALTNLSEVIDGFEFATSVTWGPSGEPVETLMLGYPRLGRVRAASGLVLEYNGFTSTGGNVAGYTWSDGPGLFTRSWATTETEEGVQLAAVAQNNALITSGYPLIEQSQGFEGVESPSGLQAHANALSAYAAGHRVTAEFVVMADEGMELGDWQLGDDIKVRISDYRWPPNPSTGAPGFVNFMRIVGYQIQPGVQGAERYSFAMADFLESL